MFYQKKKITVQLELNMNIIKVLIYQPMINTSGYPEQ